MAHLTNQPLAYLTSSAIVSQVIAFIKQHITFSFERSRFIISDSSPWFAADLLERFLNKYSTGWKTVMAYAPTSNDLAERMVCTTQGAIGKMVHRKLSDWDLAVPRVPYRYRPRRPMSETSPVQLLYGASFGMKFERVSQYEAERPASD